MIIFGGAPLSRDPLHTLRGKILLRLPIEADRGTG
jgi:hypothetical protein